MLARKSILWERMHVCQGIRDCLASNSGSHNYHQEDKLADLWNSICKQVLLPLQEALTWQLYGPEFNNRSFSLLFNLLSFINDWHAGQLFITPTTDVFLFFFDDLCFAFMFLLLSGSTSVAGQPYINHNWNISSTYIPKISKCVSSK